MRSRRELREAETAEKLTGCGWLALTLVGAMIATGFTWAAVILAGDPR